MGGGIMLSVQKTEITRTHAKIKFYTVLIFFSSMNIQIFTYGGPGGWHGAGRGRYPFKKLKKNHKNSTHSKIKIYIIFI